MAHPVPQHVHQAQAQLAAVLTKVEGKPVDLLQAPWADVEKTLIKVLGGPFQPNRPEHQMAALGIAGAFAERLARDHQAFWFPNRDSPEGATLGFPDALIMLSPFGAVVDSLANAKLPRLDDLATDIRRSLGEAKFGGPVAAGAQPPRMSPEDYQRLFDPGFLQFIVLDEAKAKNTFEARPDALTRDLRDAFTRTQPPLPAEVRQQFEGQILAALKNMDQTKPLADQVDRSPRLMELLGHLCASVAGTGAAPEEFWQDLVLPLLFIGAPANFPPLDTEELDAFRQGVDSLSIFVDTVPYAKPAPEEGLLGAFEPKDVSVPHPAMNQVGSLRMLKLNRNNVKALLEGFDADKTRDSLQRFTAYLEEKAQEKSKAGPQLQEVINAALGLLTELKRAVINNPGDLCLRRITEAEAASEPALSLVRKALQGGRIILTSK